MNDDPTILKMQERLSVLEELVERQSEELRQLRTLVAAAGAVLNPMAPLTT